MNIDSMIDKIKLFDDLVVNSGFKRDVTDYINSIQQNPTITFMAEISKKVQTWFDAFDNNSLNSELTAVLTKNQAFTSQNTVSRLQKLDSNKTIEANAYLQELMDILSNLNNFIHSNESEITEVRGVLERYTSSEIDAEAEEKQALISLVFKDDKTTGGLNEFSRVLSRWNNAIRMFHRLVKSDSPREISLVQVQKGSIDVIFSVDIDVAADLTDLIIIGYLAYRGYLNLKLDLKGKIVKTFAGNARLIELEKQLDVEMFENIGESIRQKVMEKHKERKKSDETISTESVDKMTTSVSEAIIDHVVKGNEVKLLTEIKRKNEQGEEEDISKSLRKETVLVREKHKKLSLKDKRLLLEKYSVKDKDDTEEEDS